MVFSSIRTCGLRRCADRGHPVEDASCMRIGARKIILMPERSSHSSVGTMRTVITGDHHRR